MRGTDVPAEEIKKAEEFLRIIGNKLPETFATTRADIIRMLAWYANVRLNGDNSGNFIVNGEAQK